MSEPQLQVHDQVEQYLPEQQQKEHLATVDQLNRQALALVVHDEATETQAAELLGRARQRQQGFEGLRTAIVNPFNQHIRRINAYFNGLAAAYDGPREVLEKKLKAYRTDLEKRLEQQRAEEAKKLEQRNTKAKEKATAKGMDANITMTTPHVPVQPAAKTVQAQTSRLTYREDLVFEVNPEARENPCKFFEKTYIALDERKLAAAVRGKLLPPGNYKWGRVYITKTPVTTKL